MEPSNDLSAYEKQRLENIARNQKVLEALGLVRGDAELHQELRNQKSGGGKKRQKLDPYPNSAEAVRADVRRSQRLAGLPADDADGTPVICSSSAPQSSRPSSSAAHDEARAEYEGWTQRWSQKQAGATLVGTASYAHTLMRVMTMTETALANRIKAIERACGQHAVAKQKLFATILALEGYIDLAEEASSAYERLREKLGEPVGVAGEQED